jgi:NADPH-dependent 2,4-dienoyl-CoA reductase/sulfur reductase-like enzyme
MPHVLARSTGPKRNIVVVGAGPAGLEAARVSAERGHAVVLFEAASDPGGQVRLLARTPRRKEMIGIVDWRAEQLQRLGVEMRFNTIADDAEVAALQPDIVLVATGGLPQAPELEGGHDLVVSSWDILSGDAKIAEEVLLYDDNGAHPGMQAAEMIADAGSALEIVSPERYFAPEVGGLNHVSYAKAFHRAGVRITINSRVAAVRREGNKLAAEVSSDYGPRRETRIVDQVVVEHGTLPLDDLYFALKEQSINRGEVDYRALIAGRPQEVVRNPDGRFRLFRIGDAVASRNIHAAIYDALRLCKEF